MDARPTIQKKRSLSSPIATMIHSQPLTPLELIAHIQAYNSVVHGRIKKPMTGTIQAENASPIVEPKIQKPRIQMRGQNATLNRKNQSTIRPVPASRPWWRWESGGTSDMTPIVFGGRA